MNLGKVQRTAPSESNSIITCDHMVAPELRQSSVKAAENEPTHCFSFFGHVSTGPRSEGYDLGQRARLQLAELDEQSRVHDVDLRRRRKLEELSEDHLRRGGEEEDV